MIKLQKLEEILLRNGVALRDEDENYRNMLDIFSDLNKQKDYIENDEFLKIASMFAGIIDFGDI